MNGMCHVSRDHWTSLLAGGHSHRLSVCPLHAPPRPAARSPSVPLGWFSPHPPPLPPLLSCLAISSSFSAAAARVPTCPEALLPFLSSSFSFLCSILRGFCSCHTRSSNSGGGSNRSSRSCRCSCCSNSDSRNLSKIHHSLPRKCLFPTVSLVQTTPVFR